MDTARHLPLKPNSYLLMLLLAEEPTYGVSLLERMEERSGGSVRLNAGSLYRLIAQLVDDELLEPHEEVANPLGVGAPRKIYAVTPFGREVLSAEAQRQRELLALAGSLDLLGEG